MLLSPPAFVLFLFLVFFHSSFFFFFFLVSFFFYLSPSVPLYIYFSLCPLLLLLRLPSSVSGSTSFSVSSPFLCDSWFRGLSPPLYLFVRCPSVCSVLFQLVLSSVFPSFSVFFFRFSFRSASLVFYFFLGFPLLFSVFIPPTPFSWSSLAFIKPEIGFCSCVRSSRS